MFGESFVVESRRVRSAMCGGSIRVVWGGYGRVATNPISLVRRIQLTQLLLRVVWGDYGQVGTNAASPERTEGTRKSVQSG
jgi:hypothetical protein